ncbi:MAG: hypothetical protein D6778_07750 [Nitrospirae bacterium]|nr:MAG: hypothetical protein D6778_07750 [Nitrospirota bacterium]
MNSEELTDLEKELERLRTKKKGRLWKTVAIVVLLVGLLVFLYDIFQDLEDQKRLVSEYQTKIKKLEIENRSLKEELLRCRQGQTKEEGLKDARNSP